MRCPRVLDLACEKKENQDIHIDEANGGYEDAFTSMIERHERCKIITFCPEGNLARLRYSFFT